ncbi:MAG: tetratricopeptide repeat protein [Planctomycetota bacterium]
MIVSCFVLACLAQAPSSEDLVKQATAAWAKNESARAFELVSRAIDVDPKNSRALRIRAAFHEAKGAFPDGIRDWTSVLKLDSTETEAYHARGCLHFKAGQVAESLADFDVYLQKRPERRKEHWQRGISCYYAGRFDEGRRQFEVYQDFDDADVENAVWRFMCMVRSDGLAKAQGGMLKIGDDRRVPMRDIYELYRGKKTPDDVLAAAVRGDLEPALKSRQLFYAHLYLGIWFDLLGDRVKALDHLNKAANDYRIDHYMGDVARVHRDLLANAKAEKR